MTDDTGTATVRYPRYAFDQLPTGALSLRVEHPEYCPARESSYKVMDNPVEAATVKLLRGATLRVSGHLPGSTDAVPVYPQENDTSSNPLPPGAWKDMGGNGLETHQLAPGRHYLRLAHRAADSLLYFSEMTLLSVVAGTTRTLDLELTPGVRVEGRVDASVPRPVRGGHVVASVCANGAGGDENWVGWFSSREVAADGSFAFESLPPGVLEMTVLCDGYVSKSLPGNEWPAGIHLPQRFDLANGRVTRAEITMEATAACLVKVLDSAGVPVRGARVALAPNVHWAPGGNGLFDSALLRMEDDVANWRESWDPGKALARMVEAGAKSRSYEALTDDQGTATVRNLPVLTGNLICVDAEGYEPYPPHDRLFSPTDDKIRFVSLVSGETATATAHLKTRGKLPEPEQDGMAE